MRLRLVLVVLGLLAVWPALAAGDATGVRHDLHAVLANETAALETPGAVAAVSVPGRVEWEEAIGVRNVKTGAPLETGDVFRIGSITKTFVVTVLLELQDRGLVDLDDPISRYVAH